MRAQFRRTGGAQQGEENNEKKLKQRRPYTVYQFQTQFLVKPWKVFALMIFTTISSARTPYGCGHVYKGIYNYRAKPMACGSGPNDAQIDRDWIEGDGFFLERGPSPKVARIVVWPEFLGSEAYGVCDSPSVIRAEDKRCTIVADLLAYPG